MSDSERGSNMIRKSYNVQCCFVLVVEVTLYDDDVDVVVANFDRENLSIKRF